MSKKRPSLVDATKADTHVRDLDQLKAAASQLDQEPTKRLNGNVPEGLYRQFKMKPDSEVRSLTWLVLKFMDGYASGGE